ncbi:hypothetical protein NFI96_018029 [Prochilodus magdalenae]|nr:hypothetical protein NFI96_018029 [Prochilodus magdalenae]
MMAMRERERQSTRDEESRETQRDEMSHRDMTERERQRRERRERERDTERVPEAEHERHSEKREEQERVREEVGERERQRERDRERETEREAHGSSVPKAEIQTSVSETSSVISAVRDVENAISARSVKAGRFTVLELVEALGLSLTSSQSQTRARGVQLLSEVLQECYAGLSEREVEVLIAFYENRLKDHYAITPHVLRGLKALAKSSVLPPGSAVSILKSLFQDVHVQSLMLAERSCVYNMLISLMESREEGKDGLTRRQARFYSYPCLHTVTSQPSLYSRAPPPLSAELKGLGPDFVFGFVQAVDGERDPRNLLLAFQIARNIIHRGYDLSEYGHTGVGGVRHQYRRGAGARCDGGGADRDAASQFTEELFEVMSCYFPIDFTPPPNDPHGITQEELILTLRGVLTGTPRFAEFLVPLVIEKLDSDVQNAKVDSLLTLDTDPSSQQGPVQVGAGSIPVLLNVSLTRATCSPSWTSCTPTVMGPQLSRTGSRIVLESSEECVANMSTHIPPSCLVQTPYTSQLIQVWALPKLSPRGNTERVLMRSETVPVQAACTPVYGHRELAEFLPGLWSSIRREVFQTASERVESAGLAALSALTSCLSRSVLTSDSEDALQVFLDLVLKDCQHHLCEPDLKLVWPSAKLLQAACGASYRSSLIVTAAVLPALLEQYSSRSQCAQRRTLLEVLHGFVQPTPSSRPAEGEESVLLPFQKSLCNAVFSALAESSAGLQITATKVLTTLGQQPGLLTESDVEMAVDHLTRLVLEERDAQVSLAVVESAGSLSRLHPVALGSRMVPRLKDEIFSEPMVQEDDSATLSQAQSKGAARLRCVMALASISTQPSLVQQSAPVLLQVLASVHAGSGCFSVEEVTSVCRSLQRIADEARGAEEIGRYFHDVVIPRLLGLALQAALQSQKSSDLSSALTQEAVLSAVVPVISTACAALQTELATQMAARAVSLFLDGDVSFLPENAYPSQIQLLKVRSSAAFLLLELLLRPRLRFQACTHIGAALGVNSVACLGISNGDRVRWIAFHLVSPVTGRKGGFLSESEIHLRLNSVSEHKKRTGNDRKSQEIWL